MEAIWEYGICLNQYSRRSLETGAVQFLVEEIDADNSSIYQYFEEFDPSDWELFIPDTPKIRFSAEGMEPSLLPVEFYDNEETTPPTPEIFIKCPCGNTESILQNTNIILQNFEIIRWLALLDSITLIKCNLCNTEYITQWKAYWRP